MAEWRQKLLELVRAVSVLSLFLVGLAHAPVAAAPVSGPALAGLVDLAFCGDAPAEEGDRAPCPACRIGGAAALPSPCGEVVPAFGAVLATAPAAVPAVAPLRVRTGLPGPRGPPAA